MFKNILSLFIAALLNGSVAAQTEVAKPAFGSIQEIKLKPRKIDERPILVWLPDNYNTNTQYNVLYMHDGQMLFDSSTTWNKQEWRVDESLQQLINEGIINQTIVVAPYNNGSFRHSEYYPQEAFLNVSSDLQTHLLKTSLEGKTQSDAYLDFLVNELIPYVNANYSVNTSREATTIAGSSMGGLISLYAITKYPEKFSKAMCFSTHWPMVKPESIAEKKHQEAFNGYYAYLNKELPKINVPIAVYFTYGNKTLDQYYPPFQKKIDGLFNSITKKNGANIQYFTSFYKNQDHSENSWALQFPEIAAKALAK